MTILPAEKVTHPTGRVGWTTMVSLVFLVLVGAGGCTAPADEAAQVTRVDSAGLEIVVSPEGGIGLPWVLEDEPAVVIGEGTQDPRYQFGVALPARDERGRIAVTDFMARRVAIYDSVGSYLGVIGRAGEGPGEFTSPAQIFFSGDTVFVAELSRKVSAFDVDGTFLESWRPWQPTEEAWRRIPPEGRIRALGAPGGWLARLADGSFVLAGAGSIDPGREGLQFSQVPFGRWRPREQRIDEIGVFEGAAAFAVNSGGRVRADVPFPAPGGGPSFGAFGETLIVTNGFAFGTTSYDANGVRIRESRVAREATKLTDRMREEHRKALLDAGSQEGVSGSEIAARFDAGPFLESLPFFQVGLIVTSEGYVWAPEFALPDARPGLPSPPDTYHVFDPNGAYLGAQELPERFYPWSAGATWILGTYFDELDVQSVRLYRLLPRTGG